MLHWLHYKKREGDICLFFNQLSSNIIICGHYGAGKTNLALNLAVHYANQNREVSLADMDTVNPYFRSGEFENLAQEYGFHLLSAVDSRTNLEAPSLGGGVETNLYADTPFIMDVGGDDAGAIVLGRYAAQIKERPYSMLYVFNHYRLMTQTPEQTVALMREIESVSRLSVTGLINNSNLGEETTLDNVLNSIDIAQQVAQLSNLSLLATCVPNSMVLPEQYNPFPIQIYIKAPWQL